ncbi:bacterio-opsin activator [Halobacteriales archaeon QH_7_69_31]|nr:MAG: bacterio-opsin activator [Halobacteriales archaeon QH_7_69_31]
MGIEELVGLVRSAGIREFDELACHGDSSVVKAVVDERIDEAALDGLEYVDSWDRVAADADRCVYVVSFSAPELSAAAADAAEDLVGTCDPAVDDGGATVSLVGPQAAIAGTVGEYEAEGASPELQRLGGYDGGERPLAALTDRQREVVETAYEVGYYEVPREATATEVAAELDLDASTVVEHLQRAERNLMAHHLDGA